MKCLKGHSQPKNHTNSCNYCVAVYGFKVKGVKNEKRGRR